MSTSHAAPRRPPARRVQARAMRIANVPMRVVLGLPVATPLGKRLMLAYLTGRKSGRSYRQPLSYVRDGATLLTPGGGRWRLNLVAGRAERIRLRGRDVLATPEIVSDADEVARLYARIAAVNPIVERFSGVACGPDGQPDRAKLDAAVRRGFRIVRWHLDENAA